MLNRRDFLRSTVAASTYAVFGTGPAARSSSSGIGAQRVFLGRPLDYWLKTFADENNSQSWTREALAAFGPAAMPGLIEIMNGPVSRWQERSFPFIVADIAEASPQAIDVLLRASANNPRLADEGLAHLVGTDPRALDHYVRVVTETTDPDRRANAIATVDLLERRDFAQRPSVSDVLVAEINDSLRDWSAHYSQDAADRIESACRFIAALAPTEAQKIDVCEMVLNATVPTGQSTPGFFSTVLDELGRIGSSRAIARLFAAAADDAHSDCEHAIGVLARLEPQPIAEAVAVTKSEQERFRLAAFQFLAEVDGSKAAIVRCCQIGLEDSAPRVQVAAAIALARQDQLTPRAIQVLVHAALHAEPERRRMALRGLWRVSRAIPQVDCEVANLLQDADEEVCSYAMWRVTRGRLNSAAIRAQLVRIARQYIELDKHADWLVAEALVSTRCTEVVPIIVESLKAPCPKQRERAIRFLGELGPLAGSAVHELVDYCDRCDADDRSMLLDTLHEIGPTASTIPLIEAGLDDTTDYLLFCAAARCVGEIGKQYGRRLIPRLLAALSSDNNCIHFAAARALSECGREWVEKASQLLWSSNPVGRVGAVAALRWCKPPVPQAAFDGIATAFKDDDLAVRIAALKAIEWGKHWRPLEPAVREMCNDSCDSVRHHASEVVQAWNEEAGCHARLAGVLTLVGM